MGVHRAEGRGRGGALHSPLASLVSDAHSSLELVKPEKSLSKHRTTNSLQLAMLGNSTLQTLVAWPHMQS